MSGSTSRCRRFHPVWLTHVQVRDLLAVVTRHMDSGVYWDNQERHGKRMNDIRFALIAADWNCADEMERPR